MTKRQTIGGLVLVILAFLGASCGARVQELTWEAPKFPMRSDLGDLAPAEGRNQRFFNDVAVTLEMDDGAQYTIETDQLWVVLYSSSEAEDRPLSWFEFQQILGRDDADIIPALSELATAVGWEFDEQAATEWVTTNDRGFRLQIKPQAPGEYAIVLDVDDDLNNTVSVFFFFPIEGEIPSEQSAVSDPPLFEGRPIDG